MSAPRRPQLQKPKSDAVPLPAPAGEAVYAFDDEAVLARISRDIASVLRAV